MPILQSTLWDFEDLLVNDGCTGIAVLNPTMPQEVQFDEHKLLIVYGKDLRPYENILVDSRVPCRDDMRFITEAEHVHSTSERLRRAVRRTQNAVGYRHGLLTHEAQLNRTTWPRPCNRARPAIRKNHRCFCRGGHSDLLRRTRASGYGRSDHSRTDLLLAECFQDFQLGALFLVARDSNFAREIVGSHFKISKL